MKRGTYQTDRPLTAPWQPPASTPGRIDFWRINALALDRLGDVVTTFLPVGGETDDAFWEGYHPERPSMVRVSLLTGAWTEPNTGRSGTDIVSLIGHLFGLRQGLAAARLARWLNVEVVAHV
jgi:hypothetical protein